MDVPGKKLLSIIVRGVPGNMVLSQERPDSPRDVILVKDTRAIKIEDIDQ